MYDVIGSVWPRPAVASGSGLLGKEDRCEGETIGFPHFGWPCTHITVYSLYGTSTVGSSFVHVAYLHVEHVQCSEMLQSDWQELSWPHLVGSTVDGVPLALTCRLLA